MKVYMDVCEALKALFRALFPPSEALLVLGSSYSTAEELFHMVGPFPTPDEGESRI